MYSLISTGTIGLITDQELRQTAITVFVSPVFEEIIDEGKGAEYRQLFRTTVAASVQRELLKKCGDRVVQPLDYDGIVRSLDYPCTLDLPAASIHATAKALLSHERLVPALQLRFADVETELGNLQRYNTTMSDNLRDIAGSRK